MLMAAMRRVEGAADEADPPRPAAGEAGRQGEEPAAVAAAPVEAAQGRT